MVFVSILDTFLQIFLVVLQAVLVFLQIFLIVLQAVLVFLQIFLIFLQAVLVLFCQINLDIVLHSPT